MLTNIELTDFQCHKSLSLDLGKITTLVGPSDSGKSAIIRALDWAVFNNGRSSLLVRRGAKDASVTIRVDGHVVTRTTQKNAYIIDGTELSSIGRSQPVDVPEIFRMGDDNMQRQHEYLFWFSATGSELTRNFNRVVDLSKLDEWVRVGIDTEKKHKQDVQYYSQRLDDLTATEQGLVPYELLSEDLKKLRDEYSDLSKQNEVFTVIRGIRWDFYAAESARTKLSYYHDELTALLDGYVEIDRAKNLVRLYIGLVRCAEYLSCSHAVASLLRVVLDEYSGFGVIKSSFLSIGLLSQAIKDCDRSLSLLRVAASVEVPFDELFSLRNELSELARVHSFFSLDIPDTSPVCLLLEKYWEISSEFMDLNETITSLRQSMLDAGELREEYKELKSSFDRLSEGVCPLCGQSKEGHIHE